VCGEVKRGIATIRFIFEQGSTVFLSDLEIFLQLSPTFLIFKLFFRRLLVGVREGFGVGISLSYKWKQIGVFFRRIVYMSMNFLAAEIGNL
jgi:hypothetical protein